jgi:hypothetical protein
MHICRVCGGALKSLAFSPAQLRVVAALKPLPDVVAGNSAGSALAARLVAAMDGAARLPDDGEVARLRREVLSRPKLARYLARVARGRTILTREEFRLLVVEMLGGPSEAPRVVDAVLESARGWLALASSSPRTTACVDGILQERLVVYANASGARSMRQLADCDLVVVRSRESVLRAIEDSTFNALLAPFLEKRLRAFDGNTDALFMEQVARLNPSRVTIVSNKLITRHPPLRCSRLRKSLEVLALACEPWRRLLSFADQLRRLEPREENAILLGPLVNSSAAVRVFEPEFTSKTAACARGFWVLHSDGAQSFRHMFAMTERELRDVQALSGALAAARLAAVGGPL